MASSSYVRLRGLPFSVSEAEIAQWFAAAPGGPLTVLRVFFTYNGYGRKNGEAVRQQSTHAHSSYCDALQAAHTPCATGYVCAAWLPALVPHAAQEMLIARRAPTPFSAED
eukprot:scaffold26432_cov33-Tisochrysis_lutea.AAC.5